MLYSNKPLHQDPHWLSYPEPTPDYAVGQNQCVCVCVIMALQFLPTKASSEMEGRGEREKNGKSAAKIRHGIQER